MSHLLQKIAEPEFSCNGVADGAFYDDFIETLIYQIERGSVLRIEFPAVL